AFVRDQVSEIWGTNVEETGSQFRSRDFFPLAVSKASRGDFSFISNKLSVKDIVPEEPKDVVGYIDSFGNIKTTLRTGDAKLEGLAPGTRLKVTVGTHMSTATVATGSFNIMEGDLALAPGSSGHEKRYWELFKRGGSASDEFAHPTAGTPIKIQEA
ncbi:MAG TPA: hypothetical protein PKE54_23445, partial [Candidatus Obscuribacter sp.]|nr:hypothetical protein [Candidatus Obscuribacter sp.]